MLCRQTISRGKRVLRREEEEEDSELFDRIGFKEFCDVTTLGLPGFDSTCDVCVFVRDYN